MARQSRTLTMPRMRPASTLARIEQPEEPNRESVRPAAPVTSSVPRVVPDIHALDLAQLTLEELQALKERVDVALQDSRQRALEALRISIEGAAATLGISPRELLRFEEPRRTAHKRGQQPVRYRGPNGEEWSGKGPAPRWMKPLLAQGKTKADFLIPSQNCEKVPLES